jgi:hypothetical protein
MNQQSDPDTQQEKEPRKEGDIFLYKDSGIQENHGYIPIWLVLVAIALVVWAVYYTVAYWGPPPG